MGPFSESRIRFAACNHAFSGFGAQLRHLLPSITIVPTGVPELIDRQAEHRASTNRKIAFPRCAHAIILDGKFGLHYNG